MQVRKFFYYSLAGFLAVSLICTLLLSRYAEGSSENSNGQIRLIVRGDDIGSCHAANIACIKSYKEGIMRTVEVMIPCPWFEEAAKMLQENPGLDVGVHLTLTSEWDNYKWGPLTLAPSLVDEDGYFYSQTKYWGEGEGMGFLDANPNLQEVEKELRAQIETAMKKIPQVSHLSAHMGTATSTPELNKLTTRLAKEYDLFIDLREHGVKSVRGFGKGTDTHEQREEALAEKLEILEPGLYLLVEHPGMDTPEMQAIGHAGYENVANDREGVTRAFTSKKVKQTIERKKIELLSYRTAAK